MKEKAPFKKNEFEKKPNDPTLLKMLVENFNLDRIGVERQLTIGGADSYRRVVKTEPLLSKKVATELRRKIEYHCSSAYQIIIPCIGGDDA